MGLSVGAVSATLVRAAAAGLTWAAVQGLTDEALDERLYAKLRRSETASSTAIACRQLSPKS